MAAGSKETGEDLSGKCICARCPTYSDCARKGKEALYCMKGRSSCRLERYGCVCGACPVEKIKGFTGVYFCLSGKADLR